MTGRRLLVLSALAFAIACEDQKLPTAPTATGPRAPTDPSAIISDGAHCSTPGIACNPDFFFLPPMVPLPLNNPNFELGQFNNTLQPSLKIDICELKPENLNARGLPTAATGCVTGDPLKTFAPGTVKLVNLPLRQFGWWTFFGLPPDGFYYVLWDTRQSNLNVNKFYRIKVLIAGPPDVVLGVADVDPISSLWQWRYTLTGEVIQLINGFFLPIPFRVEHGGGPALCGGATLCSSTTVTGHPVTGDPQVVPVQGNNGPVAGAVFPDGWLPTGPGLPTSVVVTISSVNTGVNDVAAGTQANPCHANLTLEQFNGCFKFTTTPALAPVADGHQFARAVTVVTCYVLHDTGDPREKYAQIFSSGPNEPAHPLVSVSDALVLTVDSEHNCGSNFVTVIGSNAGSNALTQLASEGWRRLKGGLGRVFGVKTAYAVDLGLGGLTLDFSNDGPAINAQLVSATFPDPSVLPGETATLRARIIGTQAHDGSALSTGIPSLPVTFTLTEGNGGLRPVGSVIALTSQVTTLTNSDVISPGSEGSGGGFAGVDWTPPVTPGVYTMTVTSPVAIGVVTYHVTVRANLASGGIFTGRTQGIIGTAALFDPIAFRGAVQISGPPSWNGGNPINTGVYQPTGTSANRAIWWAFVTPISGSYQAQSLSGAPIVTAPFLVAVATRGTPQLTSVSQPGAGQVQITWNSQSNSSPCLVRVNALPFLGTVLADLVVPCSQHSYLFTGLPLVVDGSYQVSVYEFAQDVTGAGAMGPVFDVGSDDAVFVATADGPPVLLGPVSPFALSTSGMSVIPPPPPVNP